MFIPGLTFFVNKFRDQIKLAAAQQVGDAQTVAYGHIATYDPKTGRARAIIPSFTDSESDDSGYVLSGWFPLGTGFAGSGYGVQYHPVGGATQDNPTKGEQVMLTFADRDYGTIAAGHMIFSQANPPPNTSMQPGEMHMQSQAGSNVSFKKNGDMHVIAAGGGSTTQASGGTHSVTAGGDISHTSTSGSIGHTTNGSGGNIEQTTNGSNANISHTTNGSNAGINKTTNGPNSSITISTTGLNSSVALSSATGISLTCPPNTLGLPAGGVGSAAMAPGAAATNVGTLGGDLSGTLPDPDVVGASTVPSYSSNAAAIAGGLAVGKLYANPTISGSEHVLCVVH